MNRGKAAAIDATPIDSIDSIDSSVYKRESLESMVMVELSALLGPNATACIWRLHLPAFGRICTRADRPQGACLICPGNAMLARILIKVTCRRLFAALLRQQSLG